MRKGGAGGGQGRVSVRGFPANREKNREFAEIPAIRALPRVNSRSDCNVLHVNSLLGRNREFFCSEQGMPASEQGISGNVPL